MDGYTFEMYEAEQMRLQRLQDREEYEMEEADRIIEDRWAEERGIYL